GPNRPWRRPVDDGGLRLRPQGKDGGGINREGGNARDGAAWGDPPPEIKKAPPGYQDVLGTRTPVVSLAGGAGTVRVIAGEFEKERGPARTFTPIELWDMRLRAGKVANLHVPAGQSTALLVLRGGGRVNGSKSVDEGELAVLDRDGGTLSIEAGSDPPIPLLSGKPLDAAP